MKNRQKWEKNWKVWQKPTKSDRKKTKMTDRAYIIVRLFHIRGTDPHNAMGKIGGITRNYGLR